MKIKLTIGNRISLYYSLPKEGNSEHLDILQEFLNNISFKKEETKKFNIREVNNTIKWDDKLEEDKEFEINEKFLEYLKGYFKLLNDNNKLNFELNKLYKKLVLNK